MSRKKTTIGKNNLKKIGGRIKSLQKSAGLNQVDFGKSIGISQSSVSDLVRGLYPPSNPVLLAIQNQYSVNPNEILPGVREPVVEYAKGDDPFTRSVSGLRQIFDSQDQALIAAIQINIQAFQLSIHKDRQINQQSEEIQKLKDECEELKKRVDALEKGVAGNIEAGSGSRTHTGDATRKKES